MSKTDMISLRAGPVRLVFDPSTLWTRWWSCGETEIVRGVYPAIRDADWHTLAPRITWRRREIAANHFLLELVARYGGKTPFFAWDLRLTGTPDGAVTYAARGTALKTFRTARTGFCVLHPADLAGQRCRIEHTDGRIEHTRFPREISPHQPFFEVRAISHAPARGVRVDVRMEGETFETEDQRNWSDASFKTYCRPLARPFPYTLRRGDVVEQHVRVQVSGAPHVPPTPSVVRVRAPRSSAPLPQFAVLLRHGSLSEAHVRALHRAGIDVLRDEAAPAFVDFNRSPRIASGSPAVALSLDAQVHAFDASSIAETTATYAVNVAQARRLAGGLPVAVQPLRFGCPRTGNTSRPDPRQRRAFGGAWLLASIGSLVEGRAHRIAFEPELLLPRTPAFAVLQACAGFSRATPLHSNRAREIAGIALRGKHPGHRILVANLAAESRTIRLEDLPPGAPTATFLFQDGRSASANPVAIRRTRMGATVTLPAHGVLQLDFPPRR